MKNVGVLKSLSITVYGANFPNGLGVVVEDQDGTEQTMFMDYLQFDGWRTLTWNNPNYVTDVRNRELRKFPLYPKGMPYLKLKGIFIYRDAAQEGGDFVTYFKDIKITYDKAIIETTSATSTTRRSGASCSSATKPAGSPSSGASETSRSSGSSSSRRWTPGSPLSAARHQVSQAFSEDQKAEKTGRPTGDGLFLSKECQQRYPGPANGALRWWPGRRGKRRSSCPGRRGRA